MARIRICGKCRRPLAECICEDDETGLTSLDSDPPAGYDGPVHDADGSDGEDAA
jgi:hypothetical protein